ncbi:MAG: helix-turn-helix transcriptional regulator [Xenococcus sp. MO_188.B8]|nr:helix-turn-helix transcriptional regulator [Xenococcus sp. MO_188.B8]
MRKLRKTFNTALRLVMAEYNIKNTDLADKTGLSKTTISNARQEDSRIYSDNLQKIADGLSEINVDAEIKFWQLVSGYQYTNSMKVSEKSGTYKV